MASSILISHNSCDLTQCETQQIRIRSDRRVPMTTTPPPGPTCTPRGFGIDPRPGAAALRVQQPPRRTPVLKPSSNSSLAIASITRSATSPSYLTPYIVT